MYTKACSLIMGGALCVLITPVDAVSAPGAVTAQTQSQETRRSAVESAPGLPQAVDQLAAQILAALPKGKSSKIAVAAFINLGPTAHEKKMGQVVSELLGTRLSGKPNVTLIERQQLERVLEELKLSMLGLTEGENAEKVGKLLGAEAMIVGSVAEVSDKFAITARHVDVGSGRVAFAKEAMVPQADAIALSSKYIVTRSRGDALFRSLLVPGWGQMYNNQEAKGYVFTGVTLGLIGAGIFQRLQYQGTHDDYMAAGSTDKATELYDKMSNQYEQSSWLFAIAGGLWAVNIVDAFISGTSASEVRVSEAGDIKPMVAERDDGTRLAMLEYTF